MYVASIHLRDMTFVRKVKNLATCVLQTDQKGVLIRRIEPTAPVNKSLKKGDILLSFDGVDIANDGTVPFRSGERISFNYLVSRKYTNEEVTSCATYWAFVQHWFHSGFMLLHL